MTNSISQNNGLLPKIFTQHGFTIDLDDHVQIVRRHGEIATNINGQSMVYGYRTDPRTIYEDIAAVIEIEKAVTFYRGATGGLR